MEKNKITKMKITYSIFNLEIKKKKCKLKEENKLTRLANAFINPIKH